MYTNGRIDELLPHALVTHLKLLDGIVAPIFIAPISHAPPSGTKSGKLLYPSFVDVFRLFKLLIFIDFSPMPGHFLDC